MYLDTSLTEILLATKCLLPLELYNTVILTLLIFNVL